MLRLLLARALGCCWSGIFFICRYGGIAYSYQGSQACPKACPIRLKDTTFPYILEALLYTGFVPEPGGQEADHTKRADPGEHVNIHRQPDAKVEAHEG